MNELSSLPREQLEQLRKDPSIGDVLKRKIRAELSARRDAMIIEVYPVHGAAPIAAEFECSRDAVKHRAHRLGLVVDLSNEEAYIRYRRVGVRRPEHSKVMKKRAAEGRVLRPDEIEKGIATVALMRDFGLIEHARGMLGKKHSDETIARLRATSTGRKLKLSSAERQRRRERLAAMQLQHPHNGYSRSVKGKRADLGGQFFRSRWEANYARYLNFLKDRGSIRDWDYERVTFEFPLRRGTVHYTPDFRVWMHGVEEPEFHEVKGWMDKKSKTKLRRMKKYYPDVKILVIDQPVYTEIKNKLCGALEHWE